MKLLSVVGARPQFVKLAPVHRAIAQAGHKHVIVHTGQHYDRNMSDIFFEDLEIPEPDVNLGVGSSSHGVQTGAMLGALEATFVLEKPDWLVVYGDTNSTLAAALAAVKLGIRVAHVEAGLRSFNRAMPEEHNRVLTDHCADLLLAPTAVAAAHLQREGLADRTRLVGDVMVDVFRSVQSAAATKLIVRGDIAPALKGPFYLATIHRQESTDDAAHLAELIDGLAMLDTPVLLAAHPRLLAKAMEHGIQLERGAIRLREPLAYAEMVAALGMCAGVITDSGGLQKEAFLAARVCTTLRTETEWVETIDSGWNALVADIRMLPETVARPVPSVAPTEPYGDGAAGVIIVDEIGSFVPQGSA